MVMTAAGVVMGSGFERTSVLMKTRRAESGESPTGLTNKT